MKKTIIILYTLALLLIGTVAFAQSVPQKFNYQAIARNSSGQVLANTSISVRFTILDSLGNNVYSEDKSGLNTNQFGLFTHRIGTGTNPSGSIAAIANAKQPVSIKTEFDPANGTNYQNMGTTELVSVPFALYAASTPNNLTAGTGIDITNNVVTNTAPNQAVTITAGPGVTVSGTYPNFTVTATDQSATNELQTISYDSTTRNLALSNNGGTVKLPNHSPAGSIMAYGGITAPDGWLLCDGAEYNNTQYPALAAAISTNFGSTAPATKFRVPDFRGRFLRGVDGNAGNDPDKNSRLVPTGSNLIGNNVGSVQGDEFKSHTHPITTNQVGALAGASPIGVNGANQNSGVTQSTNSAGGSETRPKNIYVNYIIKY